MLTDNFRTACLLLGALLISWWITYTLIPGAFDALQAVRLARSSPRVQDLVASLIALLTAVGLALKVNLWLIHRRSLSADE